MPSVFRRIQVLWAALFSGGHPVLLLAVTLIMATCAAVLLISAVNGPAILYKEF